MILSKEQENALNDIRGWFNDPAKQQVYRLFGAAGTGKTSLAVFIANELGISVAFATFTGKAALVMQKKGCWNASTIHSLIYVVVGEEKDGTPIFDLNPASPIYSKDLIIIDECSMVDEKLGKDLLSFEKPILVLGDPEQLPPVKGAGFFTNHEPDFVLREIHRQALDNPIIRLSRDVRNGIRLKKGNYDGKVEILDKRDFDVEDMLERMMKSDQLIVGMNKTRHVCNELVREKLGREDWKPVVGDRLVCLRNNRLKKLLNGGLWSVDTVKNINEYGVSLMLKSEDFEHNVYASVYSHPLFFEGKDDKMEWKFKKRFDEFNYGYALTTHKCQGSQWKDVTLFDESHVFREDATKWLYTGITRAEEKLTIFL